MKEVFSASVFNIFIKIKNKFYNNKTCLCFDNYIMIAAYNFHLYNCHPIGLLIRLLRQIPLMGIGTVVGMS
jgi:hypothetical protein